MYWYNDTFIPIIPNVVLSTLTNKEVNKVKVKLYAFICHINKSNICKKHVHL